jgi:hypothetical protein
MRLIGVFVVVGVVSAQAVCGVAHADDVTVTIDFSKPEDARKQAEVLTTALSGPDNTVKLDLKLVPEMVDDRPNYNVRRVPLRGGARNAKAVKCDDGWARFGSATASFSIEFGTIYPHLVLTILHGTPQQAPFQTAACEYAIDGPDVPVIVFRGVYAKSVIAIPTAIDVELRPIRP